MFLRWFFLIFLTIPVQAQKQLALVRRGHTVGNFPEGSYIRLIMKDGTKREGRIVELMEFSMITSADTIAFNKILKVGIPKGKRKGLANTIGKLLVVSGVLYAGIDQINRALGYTTTGGEERVLKTSAVMVATGGVLMLIRPHYQRVNSGTFLRTVDYKSPFYKNSQ